MVVRASTFDATAWDKRTLDDQEKTIGRFKVSGQPLGHPDDPTAALADPEFASDPSGAVTPLRAHIRKSNPRGPGDDQRRIFRRGYPLITAPGAGPLQRGLLFVCFGRTITTQFEFITRAWTTNPNFPQPNTGTDPLRDIETVLCGGYFFVLPLTKSSQPWSFGLPS
jgi:deferrochelatase/peroxidase EfeB